MLKQNFNENWMFSDATNFRNIFDGIPSVEKINLPHDAMVLGKRNQAEINGNDTGFYPGGSYVYTKNIYGDPKYRDKIMILEFEGVYMNAMVYLNDNFIGKCPYGYTNFYVNLSKYIEFEKDNVIKVLVKTSTQLTSRWYSGSGIYRNVNLFMGELLHFEMDGLKVQTPHVDNDGAEVQISSKITLHGYGCKSALLHTELIDKEGNVVITDRAPFRIYGEEAITVRQRLWVDQPLLWSVDTPDLYTVHTKIVVEDEVVDEVLDNFGIRSLQVDAKHGLRINGKSVKLRGACLHHDNGVLGTATFAKAEERRVELLKKAGFNAIRSAHNPISKAMLEACDKLGMLVMDESFDMWNTSKTTHDYALYFNEWWKHDLKAMIEKNYNHPSVIMFTLGNEIQEIGTKSGATLNREMVEYARTLDSTRYISNAVNGMFTVFDKMGEILPDVLEAYEDKEEKLKSIQGGNINDLMILLDANMSAIMQHETVGKAMEEACSSVDICGYNYMAARYESDGKQYPNRIILGTESNPDHIGHNWDLVKKLPYVIGDFTWCGWDYIGESGIGRNDYTDSGRKGIYGAYPWYLAYCGDIDICGNRRPQSYYREIVWGLRKNPYIAVENPEHYGKTPIKTNWTWTDTMESWTWYGYEDKPVKVEVYSDAQEVELFVNNKSVGRKIVGEEFFI